MEFRHYLHTAIDAAKAAGHIHKSNVGTNLNIDTKSTDTDLVTRVDKESEAIIRDIISSAFPDHVILGEEEGQTGTGKFRWIVDPLDGTLNYAHGFPMYCSSVALEVDGEIIVGAIYDSVRDELFTAVKGNGAYNNGAPIQVSQTNNFKQVFLSTGFAYDPKLIVKNIPLFEKVHLQCQAIRRGGSAALDLAYVACGRLDGYWELQLNPWDCAAGVLLVTEAGGTVTDESGKPYALDDGVMVSSNSHCHDDLLKALGISD